MNRAWKWAGILAGSLAGIALAALAVVYVASSQVLGHAYPLPPSSVRASRDPAAIARGLHFIQAYGCTDCHGKNLQGAFIADLGLSSRNLTRLATAFSDADFDHAIRQGLRPDGTSVAEEMPSDAFQFIAGADLADMIGYIRSLPAQGDDIPPPSYGLASRYAFLAGQKHTDRHWFEQQKPALDMGANYARGRQLAMAACGECHMTALAGSPSPTGMGGPPDLTIVASYAEPDFVHFMRTGKAAGNRELPLMSATARRRFSHFSDGELDAIYTYLAARGQKLTVSPR